MLPSEPCSCGPEAVQLSLHPESSECRAAALAKLLWSQGRPQEVRDGVLLSSRVTEGPASEFCFCEYPRLHAAMAPRRAAKEPFDGRHRSADCAA